MGVDGEWASILANIGHVMLAWVLVLPIALDRERNTEIMGLRTFPLVALGACAYIRVALEFIGSDPDPKARLIQGLVTGIGFIGAGAIIKNNGNSVEGTASAASIWTVVALASAVAFEVYEVALLLAVANFFTLRLLGDAKDQMNPDNDEGADSQDDEDADGQVTSLGAQQSS
jgi:putative Mg2+ transporter-C (MgtC) family protein